VQGHEEKREEDRNKVYESLEEREIHGNVSILDETVVNY
jgi:hypothetical protein